MNGHQLPLSGFANQTTGFHRFFRTLAFFLLLAYLALYLFWYNLFQKAGRDVSGFSITLLIMAVSMVGTTFAEHVYAARRGRFKELRADAWYWVFVLLSGFTAYEHWSEHYAKAALWSVLALLAGAFIHYRDPYFRDAVSAASADSDFTGTDSDYEYDEDQPRAARNPISARRAKARKHKKNKR